MDRREAETVLADAELIPCTRTSIPEAKRLLDELLEEDIPATLGADASCKTGGCAPTANVLVRAEDRDRVVAFFQRRWSSLLENEGVAQAFAAGGRELGDDEEPPCPACGAQAPLVDGACPDCGLQLA